MCAAPTSADDPPPKLPPDATADAKAAAPPDAEALARAGWSEQELTWEQVQEAAAEALAAGDWGTAADYWRVGLELARGSFAEEDPRLATSLVNRAVAERRAGHDAAGLFAEALAVWERAEPWLAALAPERRARSSLYHLRLQRKYPGGYDRHARTRYAALAEEGRAAARALAAADQPPRGALARWRKERPAGLSDARKLLAAVLLSADPPD